MPPAIENLRAQLTVSPASYSKAARQIERDEQTDDRELRIGILASFTADPLRPYLVVEGAFRRLRLAPKFGPFGQFEQPIFNAKSEFHTQKPDALIVLWLMEDLVPDLQRFLQLSESRLRRILDELSARLDALLEALRQNSDALALITAPLTISTPSAGLADPQLRRSQSEFTARVKQGFAEICRNHADAFLVDLDSPLNDIGRAHWSDARMAAVAQIPFSPQGQIAVAQHLARCLGSRFAPQIKCLAIDLDNTLWGGVLGEDGLGGIKLGREFPGNVFLSFQKYLLSVKDRGTLLAIVSKNEEQEALEALDTHPDCALKSSDFAAWRINWQPKSHNLHEIAVELGIGLDAIAFFDDNPAEREEVRQNAPDVVVIEAPKEPLAYIQALENGGYFDRLSLTEDDRRRSDRYRQAKERAAASLQCSNETDFLETLEMQAELGHVDQDTLPRVAQLLERTNQFNLTARRHSAADLGRMIDEGAVALWLRLSDRFGDQGLVGAAIAVQDEEEWRIDTFLLSCRVIGRQADATLLTALLDEIGARGGGHVFGEYIPTRKNKLVADYFSRNAFNDAGNGRWRIEIGKHVPAPRFIKTKWRKKTEP